MRSQPSPPARGTHTSKVSPEKHFAGGKEIIVKDKCFRGQEKSLIADGFAFGGGGVHDKHLIPGLNHSGIAHGSELFPFVAGEAAIGKQGEFAGLIEMAAGLGREASTR